VDSEKFSGLFGNFIGMAALGSNIENEGSIVFEYFKINGTINDNTLKSVDTHLPFSDSVQPYNFYDNFSHGNVNNWIINTNDSSSQLIINNQLVVDNKRRLSSLSTYRAFNIDTDKDFTLETMATNIEEDNQSGWGIILRESNEFNFYTFMINNNTQSYFILKTANGKEFYIARWTKANEIKPLGANKLTIKKHGKLFYFYINEIQVTAEPFTDFFENNIGMIVTSKNTATTKEVKAAYNYFKVTGTLKK
jgi:hypothetical protein